jgi:hypothetical protein
MKQNQKHIRTIVRYSGMTMVLAIAAIIAGCAARAGVPAEQYCSAAADYDIEVSFNSSGCPTAVSIPDSIQCDIDPECIKVIRSKGKRIRWKAVPDDSSTEDPKDIKFAVVFDPLVGPDYVSHNGCFHRPVDAKAPPASGQKRVAYKYSVVRMKSQTEFKPECDALDPKVIVDN